MEKISVGIRVRPAVNKQDVSSGGHWRIEDNSISLCTASGARVPAQTYYFDNVFDSKASNEDVYKAHSKELATAAVNGFNGTVFAYGQTNSGKTYTMHGTAADPGIIPLAVFHVFESIKMITSREFLIRISFMEIYNEEIKDLLCPENCKLEIHENQQRGVFVAGLKELIVNSPQQVLAILESGGDHRHFGETNMNATSSRSHTIFRMVIESRNKTQQPAVDVYDSDVVRVSALHMVDLAGFERISKTGAGGARLREGTYINKSLVTLGSVMKKLSDGVGNQGGHIPYRDSKLTRILQPVLEGNAKTSIICTVSPDQAHIDETRSTLLFASRAKKVTTCAHVNEIMTDAALLKRQKKEIEELRRKLQGKLAEELDKEVLKLRNDLLKFELEKEKLALELEEEKKAQAEREMRIREQEQTIENLSTMVISCSSNSHHSKGRMPKEDCFYPQKETLSGVTIRSGRAYIPPTIGALINETTEGWCHSNIDEMPPADFVNIADESTWFKLNRGVAFAQPTFSVLSIEDGHGISENMEIASPREAEGIELQLQKLLEENATFKEQLVEKKKIEDLCKSLIVRILNFQDRERDLKETLRQTWMQLLQAQERERICREENVSLFVSKTRVEMLVDQIQGQLELLEKSLIQASSDHVEFHPYSRMVRDIVLSIDMHIANFEDNNICLQLVHEHSSLGQRDSWNSFSDILAAGHDDLCNIADPDELIMKPHSQSLQLRHMPHNQEMDSCLLAISSHYSPISDLVNCQGWRRQFSEEERGIAFQILKRICMQVERARVLEAKLAAAELHVVELKVEIEDMRARLQILDLDSPTNMEIELQKLRSQCERYREEINLIMEQLPTPEQEVQRENDIIKIQEENRKLQSRLTKLERHVLRVQKWRKELRRLRQSDREKETLVSQLENACKRNRRLEQELAKWKQKSTHTTTMNRIVLNTEDCPISEAQFTEGHCPSQDKSTLGIQACQAVTPILDIKPSHPNGSIPLKELLDNRCLSCSPNVKCSAENGSTNKLVRPPLRNLEMNGANSAMKAYQFNYFHPTVYNDTSNKENIMECRR